jgi:O-antigen/teichoic acid export membrane protein
VAASLAVAAQGYIDALVLSKLAPAPVVGWYGAARTIIGTLIAPATILGAAAYPRLSQVSGQPLELRAEVRAALRPLLGMGALAAIGTWLFADLAIEVVYGRAKFGPAAEVLRVFAPGFFLLFVDILLGNVMLALGLARRGAAAKLLSVVASTGLDLLLIPVCQARLGNGGVGVVLAFAGSEIIMFAAALLILPRGTVGRGALGDVARAVSAGVATLLLFRLLPPFTPLAAVPLVVLVFGGLGVVLGLFRRSDLELLRAAMRRRAAR